jgi:hypothetical protein
MAVANAGNGPGTGFVQFAALVRMTTRLSEMPGQVWYADCVSRPEDPMQDPDIRSAAILVIDDNEAPHSA